MKPWLKRSSKGFFDSVEIERLGSALDDQARAGKSRDSIHDAFRAFRYSFEDNPKEVLDQLYDAAVGNIDHLTVWDLNAIVTLFKHWVTDRANELIRLYGLQRGRALLVSSTWRACPLK